MSINNKTNIWFLVKREMLQRHHYKFAAIYGWPRFEMFGREKLSREEWKMEDFLATVRSISADKNYVQLAEFLNRSNELLTKYAGQIDAAIASLDPDQHALAFMALL